MSKSPAPRGIDYGNLMFRAMRGLIQDVLTEVSRTGLPGQHHFFITFDTQHPDAELADWLADRYPGEMTVVLQHWFDKLEVTDQGFSVTLNFGDRPEPLFVPFDAVKTFVDPSVEFGLRFDSNARKGGGDDPEEGEDDEAPMEEDADSGPRPRGAAEIVSLDKFRK